MYTIANLPAIQRDLFLSRCIRRTCDLPVEIETCTIKWPDMIISFATDETISAASVEVTEEISIPVFTQRMESLLDCGSKADAAEWVLKYSTNISSYGPIDEIRRLLCDKIASHNNQSGETVGVLKIKRRSVSMGHAKIRLVPIDDSLQLIIRHHSAQGLKSVWKSVLHRLQPVNQPKQVEKDSNSEEIKNDHTHKMITHFLPTFYAGIELWDSGEVCQNAIHLPEAEEFLKTGVYPLTKLKIDETGKVKLQNNEDLPNSYSCKVKKYAFIFKMFTKTLKNLDVRFFNVKKTEQGFQLTQRFCRSTTGSHYNGLRTCLQVAKALET